MWIGILAKFGFVTICINWELLQLVWTGNWGSWEKMPNIVVAFQCEFGHCALYVLRVKGKKTIYSARCKCCPSFSSKHANKISIMNFHKISNISPDCCRIHWIAVYFTGLQSISPDCNKSHWIAKALIGLQSISPDCDRFHWITEYFTGLQYILLDCCSFKGIVHQFFSVVQISYFG